MSEKLTWELILGDPPEPDAEQLAYEKRRAANARERCPHCGRFLKRGAMVVEHRMGKDDYYRWTCASCGSHSGYL